jgi:UDP-GlcNAc3NAcA epimerase
LSRAIAAHNESAADKDKIVDIIVHTGQHYDKGMSDVFFEELNIPKAHYNLGVGSASHGVQTAAMLEGIEKLILEESPSAVIVYGDTNSTLAGALAAVKLHVPVIHIESGLRSFNRRMPEEINRIVTDHVADLLLAPTPTAVENLKREGCADVTRKTGDIMFDTVLYNSRLAEQRSDALSRFALEGRQYALVTMHRAENTDSIQRLGAILNALNRVAANDLTLVFPMHPRTRGAIKNALPDWRADANLMLLDPLGYLDMMRLLANATLVLTDSGGLQKESFFLNRPCITMRDETEWVETVEAGGNEIVGADEEKIIAAVKKALSQSSEMQFDCSAFGDGNAAEETLQLMLEFLRSKS